MNLYYNSNTKPFTSQSHSIRFLIVQPTTMELTKNSLDFITNRFGYTPERVTMNNPDGTKSIAYLMGGREGFQPWPTKKVEAYVAWMQSPHKNELLEAVNNYPTYQVEVV